MVSKSNQASRSVDTEKPSNILKRSNGVSFVDSCCLRYKHKSLSNGLSKSPEMLKAKAPIFDSDFETVEQKNEDHNF